MVVVVVLGADVNSYLRKMEDLSHDHALPSRLRFMFMARQLPSLTHSLFPSVRMLSCVMCDV
jgi:hypothetical protein